MATRTGAVVIGGGIAGVSAAHELAAHTAVVLLEQEEQLAHHATGRSAAAYLGDVRITDRSATHAGEPVLPRLDDVIATAAVDRSGRSRRGARSRGRGRTRARAVGVPD